MSSVPIDASSRRRRPRLVGIWTVLAAAFVLRASAVLASPGYAPFGDPADYDRIARFIEAFGTYPPTTYAGAFGPAALRPPAYPYLLAGLYEVFGVRWTVVRLVAAALGTVGIWALWDVVRRLFDARLALWTAGVAAVAPSLVWVGAGLTAESLFIPLVLGAVWAVVRHRDAAGGARWALVAGLLLGLAVLTRTNGLILVLTLLVAAWVPRRRWVDPLVLLVGLVVALTPWTVRNAEAFDAFAPLGTQSGFTIAGAYNGLADRSGEFYAAWQVPMTVPAYADLFNRPGFDEVQVDDALRRRGVEYALDHPEFVVLGTGSHGAELFHLAVWRSIDRGSGNAFRESGVPESLWTAYTAGFWLFLLLVVAGAVLLVRRGRRAGPWWLWSIPVLVVLSVVPLLGSPRYRVPADPFLAILAGVALLALADRVRGRPATAARDA